MYCCDWACVFPRGGAIGFGIVVCGVVMVGLAVSVAAVGW